MGSGPPWMQGRMQERFKNMSGEEREVFKEKMSSRMRDCRGLGWGNPWKNT